MQAPDNRVLETTKALPALFLSDIDEFWSRIIIGSKDDCWRTKGRWRPSGNKYSYVRIKGVLYRAHRVAFLTAHPEWDQQSYVCHSCDHPWCCNPRHLFAGTAKDNMNDRDSKGRGRLPNQKGAQHSQSKLTDEDVLAMRREYADGTPQPVLAAKYGVGQYQVSKIVNRKEWTHI